MITTPIKTTCPHCNRKGSTLIYSMKTIQSYNVPCECGNTSKWWVFNLWVMKISYTNDGPKKETFLG